MMKAMTRCSNRGQRGFTLLEALIAFVVLAGGLLAAFRFHTTTMAVTAESKVRSEAVALAEQKLEELRSYFGTEEFVAAGDADGIANSDFDADLPSSTDAEFLLGDGAGGVVAGDDTSNDIQNEVYNDFDGDGNDDGYAAVFTRNWSVRGTNPRQVDVRVSWVDRENNAQRVQLSTLIWEAIPVDSAAQFQYALTNTSTGPSIWDGESGGGVGVGDTVIITEILISENPSQAEVDADIDGDLILSYNIEFFGDIVFTDEGLESIGITGMTHDTASCEFVSAVVTPVLDVNGDPVLDAEGNPATVTTYVGVPPGGNLYRCRISGVPDDSTWNGTLTYNPAGHDVVCTPGNTYDIRIDQTTETLPLEVVVLANNGACNQL